MKIIIGNDHTGVSMKETIVTYLKEKNYDIENVGTDGIDAVDYPDFGRLVGEKVAKDINALGIIICGTGIGISIAANKVKGSRAALCYETTTAKLAREHNNANIIALGARMIANQKAIWLIEEFINTNFDAERHAMRVKKIEGL